jgi:hypothetical protein
LPRLAGAFLCPKESQFYVLKAKPAERVLINHFDYFLIGTFFIIGIYYAAYFDDTHP